MKTLSEIIREIFSVRAGAVKLPSDPVSVKSEEQDLDINPVNKNAETKEDETETDEDAGDIGMADPDNQETDGNAEGTEQQNQPGQPGHSEQPGLSVATGAVGENLNIEEALKAAYKEGLIAGRNAVIRERYFPKNDDGIPRFRGAPSKTKNSSDIFSMAREA